MHGKSHFYEWEAIQLKDEVKKVAPKAGSSNGASFRQRSMLSSVPIEGELPSR